MALHIEDGETERLARELAELTGESVTEATRQALLDRLREVCRSAPRDDLRDIIRRGRARSVLDDRSVEEILGYDSDGVPG